MVGEAVSPEGKDMKVTSKSIVFCVKCLAPCRGKDDGSIEILSYKTLFQLYLARPSEMLETTFRVLAIHEIEKVNKNWQN